MDFPKRKSPRLKEYDYSTPGYYFVTVCTKDKKCVLLKVSGNAPFTTTLSAVKRTTAKSGSILTKTLPDGSLTASM